MFISSSSAIWPSPNWRLYASLSAGAGKTSRSNICSARSNFAETSFSATNARSFRDRLAPEVLRDPEVALFAGEKGDEIIRRLIGTAPSHLNAGALLALEIGLGQEPALIDLLREKNYRDIEAKNDYSGRTRFLFAW